MKTAITLVQTAPPIASACSRTQLLLADALLGDRALEVELHVRRDRRADHAHHQQQRCAVATSKVGVISALPTSPQSGWARKAETM